MTNDSPSIESSLTEIESLVASLESEDIELEAAVDSYSEALKKMKSLLTRLGSTKEKILLLKKDGDALFEEPYTND